MAGAAWGPPPGACSAPAGPSWHSRARSLRAPGRRPGNGGLAGRPRRRSLSGGRAGGGRAGPSPPAGRRGKLQGLATAACLAVRPGGGAGLVRPPPLPVVTATAERRGAGAGAGTPCERLRSRSPRPSAPDARSRTASAHARTSGEGGGRPGAARRPRPYVGPVQDSARGRARIASRERLSLPLGAAGKKKGPSRGGGRWSKFRTRL